MKNFTSNMLVFLSYDGEGIVIAKFYAGYAANMEQR